MSRTLSSGVEVNIEDDVIYPFFAVELLFDAGQFTAADGTVNDRVLRFWTGFGTLTYEDQDYYGTGNLLNVSAIEETVEMSARGATLTLNGVPSEVISLALSEQYQGRPCNIYFGMFQKGHLEREVSTEEAKAYITLQDGGLILLEGQRTSLTEVFTGYMDQMNIQEGAETSSIELKVENKLIDLERPRVGRFTSEYQKSVYPSDKGFDFVESLQDLKLVWGRSNA